MKKYLFLLLLCVMSITSKAQFAVSTSGETVVFSINNINVPIFRSDKRILKKINSTSFQILVDAKVNTVVNKSDISTILGASVSSNTIEEIIIMINNVFEAVPVSIKSTPSASATTLTVQNFVSTATGTITAGARFISVANTHSANNATINGLSLSPGQSINYPVVGGGIYPAMSYSATNSQLTIQVIY